MDYKIKKVKRSKHLRITIQAGGNILVTIPYWVTYKEAENFITEKSAWINKHLPKVSTKPWVNTADEYLKYKEPAYRLVLERIEYFNAFYKYKFNKVTIKNQRTMWGSCSKLRNLNFSYKLALIPSELADYIIVHELCHLKELNHSPKFWALVSETIPNYKELRANLKNIAHTIF